MSKGWYVKVDALVYFTMDCNVGVTAETEEAACEAAEKIVREDLKTHGHSLSVPWDLTAGPLSFSRSGDPVPMLDNIDACHAEPDSDFDEELEPDEETLMEVVQCLNESFHDLDESHPLKEWRAQHGIAEVRDRLSVLALYCELTYRKVKARYDFDQCFDWDFVPRFIETCIDDEFMPRSEDTDVLAILWRRS